MYNGAVTDFILVRKSMIIVVNKQGPKFDPCITRDFKSE